MNVKQFNIHSIDYHTRVLTEIYIYLIYPTIIFHNNSKNKSKLEKDAKKDDDKKTFFVC